MAFSLTGVNLDKIPEDGGVEIQIEGSFEVGQPYEVYIGDTKTPLDRKCHPGKPDQGGYIYPWTASILRCYTPLLPPGATLSVSVQNMNSSEMHSLDDILTTTYRQFQSTVFGLRKVLPVFYKTGPRDIEAVAPTT